MYPNKAYCCVALFFLFLRICHELCPTFAVALSACRLFFHTPSCFESAWIISLNYAQKSPGHFFQFLFFRSILPNGRSKKRTKTYEGHAGKKKENGTGISKINLKYCENKIKTLQGKVKRSPKATADTDSFLLTEAEEKPRMS